MSNNQILELFNWKPIIKMKEISENIKIHKVINTNLPVNHYIRLTQGRTNDQIKYHHITSRLRSNETYNNIPMYVRTKSVKNFKLSYKRFRKDLKSKPRIVYNSSKSIKYTLIWPGG